MRVDVLSHSDEEFGASIAGVGWLVGTERCALVSVLGACIHAVHHAHRQIRMTGLDIETVSLLHRLKQLVGREHFVDDSHFDGVETNYLVTWSLAAA